MEGKRVGLGVQVNNREYLDTGYVAAGWQGGYDCSWDWRTGLPLEGAGKAYRAVSGKGEGYFTGQERGKVEHLSGRNWRG